MINTSRKIVLFADNDPDFLQTRAEFLQKAGYHIIFANSPIDAEQLMEETNVHLAILDVRLVDDDSEKDISGILLAQKEEFRSIPKIILTGFPSLYTSRDALRPHQSGFQPAINYLSKEEGQDALVSAVNDAFAQQVRINWSLTIDWKTHEPIGLVNHIEPDIEGERRLNRAKEFEDLFRTLFYDEEHLRIERLLWQSDGRLAVVVFAFKEGIRSGSFVVVCGQKAIVKEEARRFEEFAPKAPGDTGTTLGERMKVATTHFAANAYTLVGNDLENVQTLNEFFHLSPDKVFSSALTTLCQETLKTWQQERPIRQKGATLNTTYQERLHLAGDFTQQQLDERISWIVAQIPTLEVGIEHTRETLSVQFKSQTFTYMNPILLLPKIIEAEELALLITVPGVLSGNNILTSAMGRAWLTDFAEAGLAPLFWNYVALESIIRFDWIETKELQRRHELERCLIFTDFGKPDIRDLEPVVRKPARAIQMIRKLAARTVGKDVVTYNRGIFFHGAHRLATFNPASPLTTIEWSRLAHILFSMAMIAGKIKNDKDNQLVFTTAQTAELRITDEIARTILIRDQQVDLAPQPFALFHYLFLNANRVCKKEELIKNVLKNEYKEDYLHTLIGRIRKVIEDDPELPRYLITVPNAGYRLIPKPE